MRPRSDTRPPPLPPDPLADVLAACYRRLLAQLERAEAQRAAQPADPPDVQPAAEPETTRPEVESEQEGARR